MIGEWWEGEKRYGCLLSRLTYTGFLFSSFKISFTPTSFFFLRNAN